MSYLGSPPASQFFAPGTDTFSGDGTTVAFTLSRNVGTVNDILVVVNNVDQQPTAYSVSVSTLTFTAAPSSGTNNIYVRYLSTNLQSIVPQAGSIVPGNFGIDGNLNFSGSARRITGDFSNATIANRVAFQTSTTNGATTIMALPNGTGVNAQLLLRSSSTATDDSFGQVVLAGGSDFRISSGQSGTGTYLPMTFYTSGSECMRIDTSGNVGIGTTTPAYKLDVVGTTNSSFVSRVANLSTGASAQSILQIGTGATAERYVNLNVNYTSQYFQTVAASITTSYTDFDTQIWRNNVGTERMRIDSSGNLLVGTTTNTGTARAQFAFSSGNGIGIQNNIGSAANGMIFHYGVSSVGSITINTTATSFNTSSDYRLKENVQPMVGALDKVAQLKPCTYTWKSDGSNGQGFIAHELQAVVPDAVTGEKDAVNEDGSIKPQGIDTSYLVATLTAAIQEQQAMIEELKTKVAALEAR